MHLMGTMVHSYASPFGISSGGEGPRERTGGGNSLCRFNPIIGSRNRIFIIRGQTLCWMNLKQALDYCRQAWRAKEQAYQEDEAVVIWAAKSNVFGVDNGDTYP